MNFHYIFADILKNLPPKLKLNDVAECDLIGLYAELEIMGERGNIRSQKIFASSQNV